MKNDQEKPVKCWRSMGAVHGLLGHCVGRRRIREIWSAFLVIGLVWGAGSCSRSELGEACEGASCGWPGSGGGASGAGGRNGDGTGGCADCGDDPVLLRCYEEELRGPPGWKLNRDWSCPCRFFDPEPGTELPTWGKWEKCSAMGPKDVDCRILVPASGYPSVDGASLDVSAGGIKIAMLFSGSTFPYDHGERIIVFDPDGDTLNAMMIDTPWVNPNYAGCSVDLQEMNEGKLAVFVQGKDPWDRVVTEQGILGGDVDGALSNLVYQWEQLPIEKWKFGNTRWKAFVSSNLLVIVGHQGGRLVADWIALDWTTAAYRWGHETETLAIGKSVFVTYTEGRWGGIVSWDAENFNRPLLFDPTNHREAASNFGTDGIDMVWTRARAENPIYGDTDYDEYLLMVSPFTTDHRDVASHSRVVRRETDGVFGSEAIYGSGILTAYRVGCGFAAHTTKGTHLSITRLSDGAEWFVKRLAPPDPDAWSFGRVIGVTCDEVFVTVYPDTESYRDWVTNQSIARIRIGSLGKPKLSVP